MKKYLEIDTDSGVVALVNDAAAADANHLRELTEQGLAFYVDGEDRSRFRIALFIDERPSGLPPHRFQRMGGSFRLSVPSGRLAITGAEPIEVTPGHYSLSVLGTVEVGPAFAGEEKEVLGERDWRWRRRVGWIGMIGCLPFLASWAVLVIYRFSIVSLIAVCIGLLAFVPHMLLRRTKRYRDIERRMREHEASFPHFAIEMKSIVSPEGLSGGHLVV